MRFNDLSLDKALRGSIKILQRKKGYRFSIDAILLGNFVHINSGNIALELGSGSGIVSFIVAKRYGDSKIYGIEAQEDLYFLSLLNKKINNIENVFFINLDINDIPLVFPPHLVDVVFTNPPFREKKSGKIPPDKERLIARHEVLVGLEDLIESTNYILKPRGKFFMVYRARRLPELIFHLFRKKIFPTFIIPIFSEAKGEAELFLIMAEKGVRREMEILGPILLYDERGQKTTFHKVVSSRYFPRGIEVWRGRKWLLSQM